MQLFDDRRRQELRFAHNQLASLRNSSACSEKICELTSFAFAASM
jgi:hypothetical protein